MSLNKRLILIAGKSSTGKSMSLMNLKKPAGVMYLNCESNKDLPFPSKFSEHVVTDPYQVYEAFTHAETLPECHTIVIDSLTYLMDMFESIHVLPSTNTMKSWGDYAQFFKVLMSQYVAKSTKNVIFTAHTLDIHNEQEMTMETVVKVKGSLMNTGIESYFSVVIASKKLPIIKLDPYKNKSLNYTDDEKLIEIKYCFQTRLTKETVNERIRSPLLMWSIDESFIDNDIQIVLDKLNTYYK